MPEYILFHQVTMESIVLRARSSLSLFQDGATAGERVTTLAEPELIAWLVQHREARQLLLRELRREQGAIIRTNVTEPFVRRGSKPGDLDVFLCAPEQPHQAAVIECKRVKITPLDARTNAANKLER